MVDRWGKIIPTTTELDVCIPFSKLWASLPYYEIYELAVGNLADTRCKNNVIITSKRRQDVILA